jgi:hypothetical protein
MKAAELLVILPLMLCGYSNQVNAADVSPPTATVNRNINAESPTTEQSVYFGLGTLGYINQQRLNSQ